MLSQKHINGQQAHEKVLDVISYQGDANKNHNKIHFTHLGILESKNEKITNVGEDVGRLVPSYIAGGNVKWKL